MNILYLFILCLFVVFGGLFYFWRKMDKICSPFNRHNIKIYKQVQLAKKAQMTNLTSGRPFHYKS